MSNNKKYLKYKNRHDLMGGFKNVDDATFFDELLKIKNYDDGSFEHMIGGNASESSDDNFINNLLNFNYNQDTMDGGNNLSEDDNFINNLLKFNDYDDDTFVGGGFFDTINNFFSKETKEIKKTSNKVSDMSKSAKKSSDKLISDVSKSVKKSSDKLISDVSTSTQKLKNKKI